MLLRGLCSTLVMLLLVTVGTVGTVVLAAAAMLVGLVAPAGMVDMVLVGLVLPRTWP